MTRTVPRRLKTQVMYGPGLKRAHCGICRRFHKDKRAILGGTCPIVEGWIINANKCSLFAPLFQKQIGN